MYVCAHHMCVYVTIHVHVLIVGDSGPLELESQAVVSCLMLVLRIEPRSSARAVQAPNHYAVSPTFTHVSISLL